MVRAIFICLWVKLCIAISARGDPVIGPIGLIGPISSLPSRGIQYILRFLWIPAFRFAAAGNDAIEGRINYD